MPDFAMLELIKTTVINTIYPPRCLGCADPTDAPRGLCPTCWGETHFIGGAACDKCGTPLVGATGPGDLCEGCLTDPPRWDRGAAAFVYRDAGRRMILGFKHGDRLDMVRPLAGWLESAGRELLAETDIIAPVPLHWRRLLKRRYNQSAELSKRLSRLSGRRAVVDLLTRRRFTTPQQGMDREARQRNQRSAFEVTRRHLPSVAGKTVLLIDDVLTSGATLSCCADALRAADVGRVHVLVLARVAFEAERHIFEV